MKRKGKRTFYGTQMDNTNKRIQKSGPSISDLPMTILVDILLKLDTKSIFSCKCVCNSWRNLISDPQFAKLHFAQAKICLLIRVRLLNVNISRALYLLEPEYGCSVDVGYCWCGSIMCKRCNRNIKVKSKLKMPLRNARVMLSQLSDDDSDVIFDYENRRWRKLKSRTDQIYRVANSCNGLLCLTDDFGYDPVIVCNPILGEFIYLPKSSNDVNHRSDFKIILGFSPKNNQYKVVRLFTAFPAFSMVEIHTLGTDSWRRVDISVLKLRSIHGFASYNRGPVYHEGALHWICGDDDIKSIVYFDLEEEQFHFYSIPSPPCQQRGHLDMEVLGGRLCVYDRCADHHLDIWVVDYDVCDSWTKLISVDMVNYHYSTPRSFYSSRPISYLGNGALLMFDYAWNELMHFDESRGLRLKHLKFRGNKSRFEVIVHTPSFISLKHIVMAGNVEVLNVDSRCRKLRLGEETYPLMVGKTKKRLGHGF